MTTKKFALRTKLVLTYFMMALLPLLSLTIVFYYASLHQMSALSRDHALEIVRKTNAQSDLKLEKVRDASLKFATDKTLHDVFSRLDPADQYELIQSDRKMTNLLKSYFMDNGDLFSYQLATSYFMFGTSALQGNAYGSALYNSGMEARGKLLWVPTFDIADVYNQEAYRKIPRSQRFYFSAVMQLKGTFYENGVSGSLAPDIETPLLIVSYRSDYFKKLFDQVIPVQNASYMVLDPEGQVVFHPEIERLATRPGDPWIERILKRGSGTENIKIDGKAYIACFDTSLVTGWTSVVLIPSQALIAEIAPTIRNTALTLGAVMFLLSLLLAFVLSGQVARPMKKLLNAIKQLGVGNFDLKIDLASKPRDEFGVVLTKFNEMNEKVRTLIQENYEAKIREKEAEVTALTAQLNPHFLYNTLNIMNWMAIDKDQKELSKMLVSLSNMLHYTTQNFEETGTLQQELDWLYNYIFIMGERFKGKFRVEYEIQDELYPYRVPRLFLQPIVENAIIHGFGSITEGGLIRIAGEIRDGERRFRVVDNGRGMDAATARKVMAPDSRHVGLKNVNTRIQLLYGKEFGLRFNTEIANGTEVIVNLPCSDIAK